MFVNALAAVDWKNMHRHKQPENLLKLYAVTGIAALVAVALLGACAYLRLLMGVVAASLLLAVVLAVAFSASYLLIRRGVAQLQDAHVKLESLAVIDALTALNNRSEFLARGEAEFSRLARSVGKRVPGVPMGCVLIDLDDFKSVNDIWGHQVGDQVLREVAGRLSGSVRPYDIIGRYDGEEFALLLPDTGFEQSLLVAERLLKAVNSEPFIVGDEQLAVTASVGVSCYNEKDRNLGDLLMRAGEGLGKARDGGRNRVAWVYHPFDSKLHT